MHFEVKKSKESFIKTRKFINLVSLIFIATIIIGSIFVTQADSNFMFDFMFNLIFIGSFALVIFIFLMKQKAFSTFDINGKGILVNKKIYNWKNLKKYHLLGESQSERIGITKIFDFVNIYKNTPTQIFKIKIKGKIFNSWVNLEVDQKKVKTLHEILNKKNIKHTPAWRHMIGF